MERQRHKSANRKNKTENRSKRSNRRLQLRTITKIKSAKGSSRIRLIQHRRSGNNKPAKPIRSSRTAALKHRRAETGRHKQKRHTPKTKREKNRILHRKDRREPKGRIHIHLPLKSPVTPRRNRNKIHRRQQRGRLWT